MILGSSSSLAGFYIGNTGDERFVLFLNTEKYLIKQTKKADVSYLLKHFLTLYIFEELIYNQTFWKLKSCVYGINGIAEVKC